MAVLSFRSPFHPVVHRSGIADNQRICFHLPLFENPKRDAIDAARIGKYEMLADSR